MRKTDRLKRWKTFLRTEYLTSDEQRLARIIYEFGRAVLSSECKEKFEHLYGHTITTNLSSLKKYGLINIQGNLWSYSDKELLPIKEYISKYAEEKIIFNYSDLKYDMESKGYVIPPEKSMRAYITEACRVDNDDREHFCHKNYVDDYSEYSWRNLSRDGLTNWILNQTKEYLLDIEKCDISQLCDYIEKQARGTDFENRIRERVKSVIGTYSGEEYPFLLEGNYFQKNYAIFDTIDFSTLGLKGGKYPFFTQIRSIILNELKKKKDSRILLTDAIRLVNESIEEPQSRNTVIRAITNKHLPSINAEVQNVDGNLYIIKVGEDIAPEPVYKIERTASAEEIEVAQEVECEEIRDRISYRLSLEWEKLESAMRRELSFYRNWMERDHIDFDEAIKKFVVFIKNATNGNLSNKLPQNLYEYWYASTDFFDRNMYVSNLTLFFEGLLSEIKFQKEGIRLHKKGLGDWTLEYPSIARCLGLPSKLLKGFDRIFCDLYFKRNRVAHGEPVDMSSADTARTISDYIALYIFTVAKYM